MMRVTIRNNKRKHNSVSISIAEWNIQKLAARERKEIEFLRRKFTVCIHSIHYLLLRYSIFEILTFSTLFLEILWAGMCEEV